MSGQSRLDLRFGLVFASVVSSFISTDIGKSMLSFGLILPLSASILNKELGLVIKT